MIISEKNCDGKHYFMSDYFDYHFHRSRIKLSNDYLRTLFLLDMVRKCFPAYFHIQLDYAGL